MRKLSSIIVFALGISEFFCLPLTAQTYTFQVVECGPLTAYPSAINNNGVVVGAAIGTAVDRGFVYSQNKCTSTSFRGRGTAFNGVTNAGEILGILGPTEDFLLENGSIQPLPSYPGPNQSYMYFKNANGLFAGNYYPTDRDAYGRGFFYKQGIFTSLPQGLLDGTSSAFTLYGLNDNGIAVGTFYGHHNIGFVVRDGKVSYFTYPGASDTSFFGTNNKNLIVGQYYKYSDGTYNVFTYDLNTSVWADLSFPFPLNGARPVGINDSGVIAAQYTPSGGLLIATPVGN